VHDASERLGLLQQVAGIGTWDYEVASATMRWSPEVYALYGLSAGAPPPFGESWLTLIHPDDRAAVRSAHTKAMEGDDSYRIDFRVKVGDDWRWIAARARIQRGSDGQPTHVNGVNMDITEQREAVRAQERSAARFDALVNSTAHIVWVIDGSGQISEDSRSWRAFTGQSFAEMAGTGWSDAVDPADHAHMLAEWARCSRARVPFEIEYRLRRHDGAWRTMLVRGTPILADDGRVATWVGFNIDVTDQREATAALKVREAEYYALADNLPSLCWMATADGSIYWYNRRWYDYTGTTYDEMQGWGWQMVHDPAVLPDVTRCWQASIDSGAPFEMTFPLRGADGVFRPFLTRIVPVRDDSGAIQRWFGNNVDVSESVAQAERLRLAQEAGGIGLWDIHIATGDVWWSDQLYRLLGLAPGSRKADADFFMGNVHPDDRPRVETAMTAMLESGVPLNEEFRLTGVDGIERWLVGRGELVRDAGGAAQRFVGVNYDVTARRVAEDALRKLNDELAAEVERAVAERAEAQAQLYEAQKLETLGQLTGGVAHDFNNLLTPIVGSLDLLRRRLPLEPRDVRLVDGALTAADRAKTLVQRLLAFGRRQLLQAEAVDIARLVAGMHDLVRRSLSVDIDIVIDIPDGLSAARVDPNQLELALLNMAINARDAMPEGGTLTIAACCGPAPARLPAGDYIRLTVTDTGTGMDAETLRRATEPFFTTKGVGRGTGLGLSMAHGLAGQTGGRLDIDSTAGAGTTVTLWIPVSAEVAADPVATGELPPAAGRGTILLVDDEDLVRTNTAAVLGDLGYDVVEAISGAEALARVSGGLKPDLVITDWMMPKMNGGSLIAALRDLLPAVPALIVTGYVDPDGINTDTPVVAKPFNHQELAAQVAALLTPAR
jgi:PAS domain S-box-containing protein